VTSYLGLVPREYSSGEQHQRGRVMRSAHPYVRVLLVQAAWRICRSIRCSGGRTADLGSGSRASTGPECRHRRIGASTDSDSVRDVAR
jgi:transposase